MRLLRHEQQQARGREARILTVFHRRCAGVVRCAFEHNFDACDADDRRDEAKVDLVVLQDRALLDMQFEVASNIAAPRAIEMSISSAVLHTTDSAPGMVW